MRHLSAIPLAPDTDGYRQRSITHQIAVGWPNDPDYPIPGGD